jgi:hypothetical protein
MQHMHKNVERVFLSVGHAITSEDLRRQANSGRLTGYSAVSLASESVRF